MSHKFVSISIVLFVLVLAAGGCMPPALGPVGGPTPAPEAKTPAAEMTAASPAATAEPQPEPQATAGAMGLRLLAPDVSKPVELAPTVSWEAIPGARSYKVWISDAGTTELLVQQEVTDLSLALGQPLKPGRTYSLLVQALDANKQAITELRTEFTTAGEAVAPQDEPVQQIPSNCYREGLLTYVDREAQICFAYPQGFALGGAQGAFAAGSQARAELRGPAIGAGPEPLFARLSVDFEPYQGVDLPQFVDEMIKRDVPAELVGKVERRQETWAGHAAEVLEPWPGQLSSRIVVVDAAPLGFDVLTFWPSFKGATSQPGADALKAEADMEALYEIVAGSFATLPPPGVPIAPEARVDLPKSCLVSGQPLYIDADQGYCMALTPEMRAKREENGSVGFYGPALDQSPDPLRVSLGVTVEPVAKGAALDKTVETYLASLGELGQQVKRAGLTLGGEPAVRLDGIPGRPSAIEVLALHEGKLAWLRFAPDLSFEKSQTEVEALVQAVTSSFGFLPGRDQTAGEFARREGRPLATHRTGA